MAVEEQSKDRPEKDHDVLCFLFALVFVGIAYLCSASPLSIFLCGAAALEFFNSFLITVKNRFSLLFYFAYQTLLSAIPVFVFATVMYAQYDRVGVNDFLQFFHMNTFRAFVNTNPWLLAVLLPGLWFGRMMITYEIVIHQFTIWNESTAGPEDKRTRDVLNLSSFTLFIIIAHFASPAFQNIFFGLAIFELVMAASYVIDSLTLMTIHFWYQAVTFSVPIFLLGTAIHHYEYPAETISFLDSFGLYNVSTYMQSNPLFAVTVLFVAWLVRLLALEIDIVNKEVAKRSREMRRTQHKHRLQKAARNAPNMLVARQQPLIETV